MSNQVKTLRSLDEISTGYTVFEKNQVLTDKELNELASYMDDQHRLTRVELLGVGVVGGLHVKVGDLKIEISKGVGITTDGDLLVLPAGAVFDRYKNYDEKAPLYPPFYPNPDSGSGGPGPMMQVFELVRENTTDTQALGLANLRDKLGDSAASDLVVVMYLESYLQNPNLCSGTDCDNRGQEFTNTLRFLLVAKQDADILLQQAPAADSALSLSLPEIDAARPVVGKNATTVLTLALPFYNACKQTIASIHAAFPALHEKLPALTGTLFGGDPSGAWLTTIDRLFGQAFNFDIQNNVLMSAAANHTCFYDFLKDITETWNTLCDVLFEDEDILCPPIDAFPKHLLLGRIGNPLDKRTNLYPSPLIGNGSDSREHARFLIWKLHVMINTFELPNDSTITVTPSRDESAALEDRAIPYYYRFNNELPIHLGWNFRLEMRGAANRNLGYRAAAYGGSTIALKPLDYQIGRYNFFRIEGHLGQNVENAKSAIEKIITDYNLPFALRAVLLHNDPAKIVIRPPFRYTPWHGFHYILRKDVASQFNDVKTFNLAFRDGIGKAVIDKKIPLELPFNATTEKTVNIAQTYFSHVDAAIGKLAAPNTTPLDTPRYSDYRKSLSSPAGNWKIAYKDTINAASTFKVNFGDMMRNDFANPVDSFVTSNHGQWLDWLDKLIDHHNTNEDNKLLFPNFLSGHPELEHTGGVVRGGTFVLVYDDSAKVVADFMLPYYAAESEETEPVEPVLTQPEKPTVAINGGFTMLQPIDAKLADFNINKIRPEWQQKLDLQKDHIDFFTNTLQSFNTVTLKNIASKGTADAGITGNFTDEMLKIHINDVETKTQQANVLRQQINDVTVDPATRTKATDTLKVLETSLSDSIAKSTTYILKSDASISSTSDAGKALNYLTQSASNIATADARTQLGTQLTQLKTEVPTTSTQANVLDRFLFNVQPK